MRPFFLIERILFFEYFGKGEKPCQRCLYQLPSVIAKWKVYQPIAPKNPSQTEIQVNRGGGVEIDSCKKNFIYIS